MVLGAATIVVTVGGWFLRSGEDDASQRDAMDSARSIVSAAAVWKRKHTDLGCPSISELVRDKALDRESRTDDPWGRRFKIRCTEDEVTVQSAGVDGKAATDDDIQVSEAWAS